MIKIIFGVIFAGALYYVINPLLGRRVNWIDAEHPDDERMRELELTKKINLKALKDIEFELASGKINDEDYLELRDHYVRKVSRTLGLIEDLAGKEEGAVDAHYGERGKGAPDLDEGLYEDEDELDENEEDDKDEEDDEEIIQGRDGDDVDEEWDEDEDDEYEHRSVKGPTLIVLALVLAVGMGVALFQMGKSSAVPAPTASAPAALAPAAPAPVVPVASQPSFSSSDQAGLEHLLQYVQENPWNVTSHIILGEYYLDAGNIDVALAHFVNAEGIKPGNGRVLGNLGKAYRKLGNLDQAIEKFRAASAAEPEVLEHLYQLGLVYGYDKGDRTQALELFEEILSRQPDEELRATVDEELRKLGLSDG